MLEPLLPDGLLIDDRYRVGELVGRGGMGAVYRAMDEDLDRPAAIKVLLDKEVGPRIRKRFRREARAVARLNHMGVAQIYNYGSLPDGSPFLAMEYVPGGSLSALLEQPSSLDDLLALFDRILDALAYTHAREVIHRDLKPQNILLAPGDGGLPMPKIVDFGIAAIADDQLADSIVNRAVGSPAYMAPEQALGHPVGPQADLYAVGVMLYEALCGRPPFEGNRPLEIMMAKVAKDPPKPVPRPELNAPEELCAIVMNCVDRLPERRYRSAAELRAALRRVVHKPAVTGSYAAVTLDDRAAPFVGRAKLLEQLLTMAARVSEGRRAGMALLEGPAGIGKTRLAERLRAELVRSGAMTCLRGAFSQAGGGERGGLVGLVEEHLGTAALGRSGVEEVLERHLEGFGNKDPEECRALLNLLRPAAGGEALPAERAFALVERFCRRVASRGPILVYLDDLHWGGPHAVAFLKHMAVSLQVQPAPMLFMTTVRDESILARSGFALAYRGLSAGTDELITRIRVEPLDMEEARQLCRGLGAEQHVADILARARGNPLYTVQLARFLSGRGQEIKSEDTTKGWTASGTEMMPEELRQILWARLDQALESLGDPDRARKLLQWIAVLGSRVPIDVLERFIEDRDAEGLDDALDLVDDLVDARVLREDGDERLEFEHGLLREAVLSDLSPRRARRVHLRAAKVKAELDAEELAGEIADHFMEAGNSSDALPHLLRAAQRAERRGDYNKAAASYRTLTGSTDPSTDPGTWARAWLGVGRSLMHGDERGAAYDALVKAGGSEIAEIAAEAWLERAAMDLASGRTRALGTAMGEAERRLAKLDAPGKLKRRFARLQAEALETEGRLEEARQALAALEDEAMEDDERAALLGRRGFNAYLRGDIDETHELLGRAAKLAAGSENPFLRADINRSLVSLASDRFDTAESEALVRAAMEDFQEAGLLHKVSGCHNSLGELARFDGRLDEAEQHYRLNIDMGRALGSPKQVVYGLLNLGHNVLARGDGGRAAELFAEALSTAASEGMALLLPPLCLNLAAAEALNGRLDAAADHWLSFAGQQKTELMVDPDTANVLEIFGRHSDRDVAAAEALRTAREQWTKLGNEERAAGCAEALAERGLE